MELNENNKFLSIQDTADMLHLKNKKTIENWLYTGVLPRSLTVKLGRRVFFIRERFEEFLENTAEQQNKEK